MYSDIMWSAPGGGTLVAVCLPLAGAVASPAFVHSVGTHVKNTWKRRKKGDSLINHLRVVDICSVNIYLYIYRDIYYIYCIQFRVLNR